MRVLKLFLLVFLFPVFDVAAVYHVPDSYLNPKMIAEIGSSDYPVNHRDDCTVFQKAIDDVNASGGGLVIVPAGEYCIVDIQMRSDVHILFRQGAIVYPCMERLRWGAGEKEKQDRVLDIEQEYRTGNIFNMGRDSRIKNVSLIGSLGGTHINLKNVTTGMRVAYVGDCSNFRIANLTVDDHQSIFSVVILAWGGPVSNDKYGYAGLPSTEIANENPGFPVDGLVENLIAYDSHYGYGTIQAHSGTNIRFRNIDCEGGVAVRLETGIKELNLAGIGGLFNIEVEDIISRKGQAALMLQPHTMKHGDVIARNISAYGSEFAVSIGAPFVSTRKYGTKSHLTPGIFKSITIDGVKAVYSDGPIVTRTAHLRHYPEELHGLLKKVSNDRGRDFVGSSIAAVSNMRGEEQNISISNIEAIGFKYRSDVITKKDLFLGSLDDLK